MAASVYWLKFPCWPRPKDSFRGFLFLPTSLALLTAVLLFFCFSSTSRLMINLHKNNDNDLDVNDVPTKQMIQISHPEPTRSSVLEFPNVSAKGDHEAADTTNDDDRTEGTQSQLPEEVPTAPKVEEDDDAPDTSVDNRREVAESQLPEQSLAASIDDDASNALDDRKEGVDSQFQEESLAGKIDVDAPDALDDRKEGVGSQFPEESQAGTIDDDAPDALDDKKEGVGSQFPKESLAGLIDDDAPDALDDRKEGIGGQFPKEILAGSIDDDGPNALDDRKEGDGSQFPEESLAGTIDDDAPDALDDKKGVGSQFPTESLAGLMDDDAPDALDDRKEGVGSQFPTESLAGLMDDDASDALDDGKEGIGSQFPEEILASSIDDDGPDALDDRKEGDGSQFPEESLAGTIDDDAPDALDDKKEGVGSQFPEESLAGTIDDDASDALDDRRKGVGSQFREESLAVEVVGEARDDNRKEGTQSQSSEESSAFPIVEVDDEAPDALDNKREETQSQLTEESTDSPIGNSVDNDNEVYHDNDLFFENYKAMNRSLKIYVYPHSPHDCFANVLLPVTSEPGGNYGSECYFKKALMKSHFITKNPSKADFFFLPFSIASMRNDKRIGVNGMQDYVQDYVSNVRQKYPYWNRTGGADHFYVACHSIGKIAMVKAEEVKKNAIQVVCSSNYFVNGYVAHKDVSLPQIWPRNGNPPRVKPSKRKRLAFFAGASNSPLRQYLVKTWQNDSEIFAHAGRLKTPYEIEFLRSKFCFYVKGFEVNTTRIGDALYHGCVPVILADHYDLPFGDILNWKSFSVVVETSDIPLMKSILKGIGDEAYLRLHKNVEKVRKHFQWHGEPIEYDSFHIVMYELWLRRNYVRVPLS